jgi:hypothetical protein
MSYCAAQDLLAFTESEGVAAQVESQQLETQRRMSHPIWDFLSRQGGQPQLRRASFDLKAKHTLL